jgi:hypothetical protein
MSPDWIPVIVGVDAAAITLGVGWVLVRRLLTKTGDLFDGLRGDVIAARTLPTDH